jgi:branched-chain amino acid aminotransferase
LFEIAPQAGVELREATLGARDLLESDEAFVTSSLKELAPIRRVDERALRSCPGPVTQRLLAAFRALTRR